MIIYFFNRLFSISLTFNRLNVGFFTKMANKFAIGGLLEKESDYDLLQLTSKIGAKTIVRELITDEVYILLLRTGLCVDL